MKDMEQKLKMQLLEQLMDEMDEKSISRLKPAEEPTVEVIEQERQEMPIEDAEEMIKDKLSDAMDYDEESMEEYHEEAMEYDEEYEDDEYEDYSGSDLMKKLQELRKKKQDD